MQTFSTEEAKKAAVKALSLLEHMDRTEKGLRERLRREKFSPEAVEEAMAYVASFGYIDDARYAQHYISYRLGIKSKQVILRELAQKGVDRDTARQAFEEVTAFEDVDEQEIIRKHVRKKYPQGAILEERELRRLYGFLARKGFSFDDIQIVLNQERIERKS